jgi:predicted ABC-type transport system involved in lysophospholipase L1 biosynthesis ATPase subunit
MRVQFVKFRSGAAAAPIMKRGRKTMAIVVLDDATGLQRLEMVLNAGRRYRAIVPRPSLKAELLQKLREAAPLAVVAPRGGFVGNLRVWQNLVLPVLYRRRADMAQLEARAEELFRQLGVARERFAELCALLPERLSEFERRLVAFVRAMLTEPEIMVYDSLFYGLSRSEIDTAARFDTLYQLHFPFRTALFVDAEDATLPALRDYPVFHL